MKRTTLPASDEISVEALLGRILGEAFQFLFLSGYGWTVLGLLAVAAIAGLVMRRLEK